MKLYGDARKAGSSGSTRLAWALPLVAALGVLLAGCNRGDTPPAAPTESAIAPATVAASESAAPEIPVMGPEIPVLAIGDSLFAGYGLEPGESYPARLEAALRARGINARIANAGVSGDTSADGVNRLSFTLDSQPRPPALVLLSLGGNDMLRGLPPEQTRDNLEAILSELEGRKLPVVIMGMLAPPNMGRDYRTKFDAIYPALARKHDAALVPFFLQPLMDKPDLVRQDRIHPTAAGVEEIVAATIDTVVAALPEEPAESAPDAKAAPPARR